MANPRSTATRPLIVFIPGEATDGDVRQLSQEISPRSDAINLELGNWDNPHRNTWVNKLNLTIGRAQRPVSLVAEGLACLAVIWWAAFEQPGADSPVTSATLIRPPDLDRPGTDARIARFGSIGSLALPFPARLLALADDSCQLRTTYRRLAADWDCIYLECDPRRGSFQRLIESDPASMGGASL